MFKETTTSFLGKKFAWTYEIGRKELKKIVSRAMPGFKFSWKLNKKTELVILGNDVDEATREEVEERGLKTITLEEWFGYTIAANEESVAGYFTALLEQGFTFDTHCNEGDGAARAYTVPLLERAKKLAMSEARLARLDTFGRDDLNRDIDNTLTEWVRQNHKDLFAEKRTYSSSNRDMTDLYDPDSDASPMFWVKNTAAAGSSDHGSLYAESETRVIPVDVLEQRLQELGKYYNFCFRASDAPVGDNVDTLLLLGALEPDRQRVTFVAVHVVHT